MLSLPFGFSSNVRRSGHAACWCPPLDGIVQFGGWPPSEQLSRTIQQDGSNCPLYLLTAKEVVKGVERARRAAAQPHLAQPQGAPDGERDVEKRRVNWLADDALPIRGRRGTRSKKKVWLLAMERHDGATSVQQLDSAPAGSPTATKTERQERMKDSGRDGAADVGEDDDGASAEESVRYDEGYQSEPSDFSGGAQAEDEGEPSSSSTPSSSEPSSRSSAPAASHALTAEEIPAEEPGRVVAPVVTAELLRALGSDMVSEARPPRLGEGSLHTGGSRHDNPSLSPPMSFHETASTAPTTAASASNLPAVLLASRRVLGVGEQFREAPPVTTDVATIPGKRNTAPLRWRTIREFIAPRTRHGHHLVYHDYHLYVMGGSYWAQGGALATTDMSYDLRTKAWRQLSSLFPPRFCAALAESNCFVVAPSSSSGASPTKSTGPASGAQKVLYAFGGSDFTQQLTDTLYRLWLPSGALQELPQYGASPRKQFKGLMVCDAQQEQSVDALRAGQRAHGRLFYMDGFQDGRPMAPALRYYSLATGFWVKVCSCPDLVRGQIAGAWRFTESVPPPPDREVPQETAEVGTAALRMVRFDVFGGMPSRRGKQRRSRVCYSFDAVRLTFDFANPLPIPGLTAHIVVPLPPKSVEPGEEEGVPAAPTESVWVRRLRDEYGISAICCGGNEDLNSYEQNSLGEPVSWVYLLGQREVPLSEQARVYIDTRKIPFKIMLAPQKDELLDELF